VVIEAVGDGGIGGEEGSTMSRGEWRDGGSRWWGVNEGGEERGGTFTIMEPLTTGSSN
jgi:hypothetical protein